MRIPYQAILELDEEINVEGSEYTLASCATHHLYR